MGIKLHVATVYQVKDDYKETPFTNKIETINSLLHDHCPDLCWDGEDYQVSENLQVPRKQLANLIEWAVSNPKEYSKWAIKNDIMESAPEFIRIIAYWIANSDQRNDFVVLSWY